jgi:tRNA (pseudouridine54-N1)-methyltransferase
MRRFVVIGRTSTASEDFLLDDVPSTSGRLDVLLRCVRASLLVSHGLRRDTLVYLVLLGGPRAPRTIRIDGRAAKFVRPDERSLATLVKKTLAARVDSPSFVDVRPGVALCAGGLDAVLTDVDGATPWLVDESGIDVRTAALGDDGVFFLGDHLGFDAPTRARLSEIGARALALGPVSIHAEDAIAVLTNELDRRTHSPVHPVPSSKG